MQMVLPNPTHSKYSNLLTDIERGQVKIPQFQRDFVWTIQKSAALLDSILKGYPVGTFIFWTTKDRLRAVRDIGGAELPEPKEGENVSFVLDGQQRLTSLYAALKGLKIERESGSFDNFEMIFVNLDAGEDDQLVTTDLGANPEGSLISIKGLLHGDLSFLASFPQSTHSRISEYKRRLESYDFPIIEVKNVPIDIATEIFTRINVGGKPLNLFEIMVAKTYDEEKNFDLQAKFDELIQRLEPLEYETISDATILQLISLLISGDCKKQNILKINKKKFIDIWDKAIISVESAVEYFQSYYRIPVSQLLPYNTLIVPFAYFFFHKAGKPTNAQKKFLEDFFWRCSLIGRYSSGVEGKLAQDIRRIESILKEESPNYDWGVDISPEFIISNGWFNSGRSFIKAILCLYAFHQPKSFGDNGLVNIRNYWLKQANSKNYHHFFPKSFLQKKSVEYDLINNIVNITIVDDWLNKREIGSKPPAQYMKKFTKSNPEIETCMETHLIGDLDDFGINENDYETFLQRRAEKISSELNKRLVKRSVDGGGQITRDDDIAEEVS